MTNPSPTPDASPRPVAAPSRTSLLLATGFGLGYLPVAPGTAGSLLAVAPFALLQYWLEGTALRFAYVVMLVWLSLVAWWSTEGTLPHWSRSDPPAIVIDEVLGQWVAYAGVLLASAMQLSVAARGAGWKSLLAGFILFRAFDVAKPFPIRRSERLPGASGVLLDDVLAGLYAALGLLLLAWRGWLK